MSDLWRRCLQRLESDLSIEDVHTYLKPLQASEDAEVRGEHRRGHDERDADRARARGRRSRRLARLTEDLLMLSKMDADRLELEIRPVKVAQLAESCNETARHRALEKELTVTLDVSDNLPDVAGDARRLQEVLQNLLDNAIQYTLPGGKIVLSADLRADDVVFTVADTGIGIPTADQPRIFERFYRVEKARTRDSGGAGLGLSIVKHLVQKMGGTVRVSSEPGKGSTFVVALKQAT